MSTQNHTREFFDLIKAIGETKSKQEEDKIIVKELATLKQHVNNTKVTLKLMKEYIVRVLYCEMLGHDASFGYFYAIKLTSSKNLLEKRVGYLAVSLCIPKDHELLLLIIANLQRDLLSTNYLEVCCALSAATKLVNAETVPALADHVLKLKRHQNPAVRKKVIALLHTFHTLAPGGVPDILEHAKEALCDEPSVMGASLGLFYDMAQDPEYLPQLKELVPSFVHILKQIKDHKFPKDYDYHRLPAPWIQVRLFKILALLGKDDRVSSESMYDALREAMTRADIGINMGHALVYECVTTITSIYPSNLLLENAAAAISRFVTSSNHNLKYLGIRALTEIVKINPKYATQHQMVVIDCLEDPDETLKRRTLSLLYTMTNASNATTIVKKLLEFARKSLDSHMRKELVENINSLAEQFTPNIFWYIDTMNSLLEIGPEFVPPSGIQNMMSVISLGAGDDDEKDEEMRRYCVDTFFEILDTKSVVHDLHLHVIAWVLGEYGFKSEQYSQADILELLCDVADRQFEEEETRVWVVSAMMKLVAHTGGIPPPSVEAVLHKYKNSKNVDLQQRCYEFLSIINCCNDSNREQIMDTILPLDGSCIDVEVDESLVFLQEFVDTATRGGAKTYVPHHMRQELEQQATKKQSELKYKEYAKPVTVPKTNMHEIFVTKETTPIELQQRSADTSHQEHSYYPSTYSTENTLNPTLLRDKARIWSDEDDTPAASTSSPFSYNPSPSVTSSFEPKTSPSFDNTFSLSKQDKPVDEPKKTGKNEKLRRDLFDGVGDLGGYKKSAARPRRNSKKIEKKAPVVQEEITPKSPDMWSEMSFRQDEPQTQQPQKLTLQEKIKLQKKQQQEQQQVQPQPVVQQQSKTQNLLSFDDFFSEPSQPVTQQTQPTKQQASAEDFFLDEPVQQKQPELTSFDELLSPSTSATTTIKTQTIQPSTIRSQSNILISLAQEAQRGGQPVTLAQDELLEVVCEKFWREDTVVFALQFKTNRGYTLSSLLCQFQAPSKFNMRYQYDEYNSPNVRGNSITFPRLQPGDTVVLLVELQLADLAGFGTNLMGTINYADQNKRNKILSVTAPIDLIDVLRPASLQVSEFGQQWVSYSHENKIQVKGAFTLQSYSEKIQKLNVNVIQTIKVEAVAAARVIGHGDTYCLVHAKILSQGLAFTVKSKDKSLCEHLCRVALKVLV